jgi:hypothetical protein
MSKPATTALTLLLPWVLSASSCGTMFSRSQDHTFGRYPFEAVAKDGVMISRCFEPKVQVGGADLPGYTLTLWGLFSLPVDLVIDTLALPVDLVAWACGNHKNDFYGSGETPVPPKPERPEFKEPHAGELPRALKPFVGAAQFLPQGLSSYAFAIDETTTGKPVPLARAGSNFKRPEGVTYGRFKGVEVLDLGAGGASDSKRKDAGAPTTTVGDTPVWFLEKQANPLGVGWDSRWWTIVEDRYYLWSYELDDLKAALARPGKLEDLPGLFPPVADLPDDATHVVCLLPRPEDKAYWGRPIPVDTTIIAFSAASSWLRTYQRQPLPKEFTESIGAFCVPHQPTETTQGEWTRSEYVLSQGVTLPLLFDGLFGLAIFL